MMIRCNTFCDNLNKSFLKYKIPLRIRNFSNTFSIDYLNMSLYNSRYPQYLLPENIFLGNYSTGKFNLNADATEVDLEMLAGKFLQAGIKMQKHGYFEPYSRIVKWKLVIRLIIRFSLNYWKVYCNRVLKDKMVNVNHNHPENKCCQFWCSVILITFSCPYIIMSQHLKGFLLYFVSYIIRQISLVLYESHNQKSKKTTFCYIFTPKKVIFFTFCGVLFYCFCIKDQKLMMSNFVSYLSLDLYFPSFHFSS